MEETTTPEPADAAVGPGLGRPTILPEKRALILQLVKAGNHYSTAIRAAGIGESTFYQWKQKGHAELDRLALDVDPETGEPPQPNPMRTAYAQFVEELLRAEHEAEARLVALWTGAAVEDWRAARDFLARRFPERWKDQSKVELAGSPGQPVSVAVAVELEPAEVTERLQGVLDALADCGALPAVTVAAETAEEPQGGEQ